MVIPHQSLVYFILFFNIFVVVLFAACCLCWFSLTCYDGYRLVTVGNSVLGDLDDKYQFKSWSSMCCIIEIL